MSRHLFKKCIISKQKNFELFQMGKCAEKCKKITSKHFFQKLNKCGVKMQGIKNWPFLIFAPCENINVQNSNNQLITSN